MSVPPTRNVARCARNIPTSPQGGGEDIAQALNSFFTSTNAGRSTHSRQRMRRVGGDARLGESIPAHFPIGSTRKPMPSKRVVTGVRYGENVTADRRCLQNRKLRTGRVCPMSMQKRKMGVLERDTVAARAIWRCRFCGSIRQFGQWLTRQKADLFLLLTFFSRSRRGAP